MKNRTGELWEINDDISSPWKMFLVISTDSPNFDERVHFCLWFDTGTYTCEKECLNELWEDCSRAMRPGSRFGYIIHRRRII